MVDQKLNGSPISLCIEVHQEKDLILNSHEKVVIAYQIKHAALFELQEICECFAWMTSCQKTTLSA